MTFEQWQATRTWCDDLSQHKNADWPVQCGGFTYDDGCGGCIESRGWGFGVCIANTDREFAVLEDAERYLWEEFSLPELYADAVGAV
jgi:hypothetical protein